MSAPLTQLPSQARPLLGRDRELALARRQLLQADVRLVTLTGPAGTGKTRLAVALAHELAAHFADGATFVDLAPIADPRLVISTIALVCGIRERRGRLLHAELQGYLLSRQVLLVIDNLEQVLPAAPELGALLAACPQIKILATSRAALRLSWEHEQPVPPLALPALRPGLAGVLASPAVALFISRAQAARPDFALTDDNAAVVVELCHRLDGLPLAIELAAARTKALPPRAILARMKEKLSLLGGGAQDWPARHRTLRSALAWSYDLLAASDQALFRRLSVFTGGVTLAVIATTCGEEVDDAQERILEGVISLIDNSLLQRNEQPDGEPRFYMLETIRSYGLEQLAGSGELDTYRRRQAAYYLELAEGAGRQLWGANLASWADTVELERDNIRAVLEWATQECGAPERAETTLRLAGALARFWSFRGPIAEGRQWLELALSRGEGAPPTMRATVLVGAGNLASTAGDAVAEQHLHSEALALYRRMGDQAGVAKQLSNLGNAAYTRGDFATAEAMWTESRALREQLDDSRGIAILLSKLGNIACGRGDYHTARCLHEESRAQLRALGEDWAAAVELDRLGVIADREGKHELAERLHEQALTQLRALGEVRGIADALNNLGRAVLAQGNANRAVDLFRESVRLMAEVGDADKAAVGLDNLGRLALRRRDPARAVRLLGAAAGLRQAVGRVLPPVEQAENEASLEDVRRQLPSADFAAGWAEGQRLSLEQAADYATAAPVEQARVVRRRSILSPREQQVTALIARGLTDRQIGEELVITEGTAGLHVVHILNKLGFRSRTQVAAWAVGEGLVPPATAPD